MEGLRHPGTALRHYSLACHILISMEVFGASAIIIICILQTRKQLLVLLYLPLYYMHILY